MIVTQVQMHPVRWLKGCSAGLFEKTALVDLSIQVKPAAWGDLVPWLQQAVQRLLPEDQLPKVGVTDWPGAFLLGGGETEGPGQWILALAVALQRWARDPVWQGRVLDQSEQRIRLAMPWHRQEVAQYALILAIRWILLHCSSELEGRIAQNDHGADPEGRWHNEVRQWLAQVQKGGLAPSTLRFTQAAHERSIPVEVMPGFVQFGWGAGALRLDSSFTGSTSNIAVRTARHKFQTSRLLAAAGLPVPMGGVVATLEQAQKAANQLGWLVVIKPCNQDQGTAVVPGIRDEATLRTAFEQAEKHSPGAVILEKHIAGDDYRLLVVHGELLMVTRRSPGGVSGDGTQTVAQLMAQANADPLRGTSKRSLLIKLALDDEALACLAEQELTPESIPLLGQFIRLRRTANISTGGTAQDVTAIVHPDNRSLAERAARIIGLDIAGVDFICPDISRSWREVGGAICEVNAQPGFRVHWLGDPSRDINGEVLDILLASKAPRIPTAAITGTNGKSTVAMMLHRIWLESGSCSGVATTAGTWVGHDLISQDNLSGLPGARMLLNDPAVEVAVLEMPRKGLIVFGHACDHYDVAALLNVQDDHIGFDGIETLGQMAELKAEVLERATKAIVVNADDERCLAMRSHAGCDRHILVARDATNPALRSHLAEGREAVFVQVQRQSFWIVLAHGAEQHPLMPLHEIPATMSGLVKFNEQNALFAVALAWAQGLPPETIRRALANFCNTTEHHPGRFNFIEGLPFEVLIDFAHNPDGVNGVLDVLRQRPVSGRRWLVNMMVGNRSRAHLEVCLNAMAPVFDRFVLSARAELVTEARDWASDDPLATMLAHGRQCLASSGVETAAIDTFPDPSVAMRYALDNARPGDQVVMLVKPWVALSVIERFRINRTEAEAKG